MRAAEFEDEARRLARPCLYLRTQGIQHAAVWGGPAVAPPPEGGTYRHWLSVDARYLSLPAFPSGVVSIFTDEGGHGGAITIAPAASLPTTDRRVHLYAHPSVSLPPVDAVFAFGSARVQEWLRSHSWQPEWGFNDNFPDAEPVRAYERVLQAESPFYSDSTHAAIGGWHLPWPDGDWAELNAARLLLWTFADSEPWVEVWAQAERQWVRQRVT